jgi:hypothetical protein
MKMRNPHMHPLRGPLERRHALASAVLALVLSSAIASAVFAAEKAADEEEGKSPPPGLPAPPGLDWAFEFSATWGSFGFANSLYTNPKPDEPSNDLTDNWFEGSVNAGLAGTYKLADTSELYGKASFVGERTYGAAPSLVGEDASSYDVEDLYIGWRSGNRLDTLGENALDVTVGRARYRLGHGLILWDGAAEGGTRGGYWTNARQAFKFAGIARLKTGPHTLEGFYLEKDELPEADSDTKIKGLNYEFAFGEDTTLGASYLNLSANATRPDRDGMDVYDLRAFTAPIPSLKALSFEAEYVKEDNGDLIDSTAWNLLVAYQLESTWRPKISYRYAIFEGDDPGTSKNEAFDGLLTGFYDWGSWWQGEIAGEYFVSNSNLISHQLRVHTKPNDAIGTGLILYDFLADQPASLGPGVTSDKIGYELDWYMDWTLNDHFTVSFVAAVADPGQAIEQSTGRTDTFVYGMVFAAYSF